MYDQRFSPAVKSKKINRLCRRLSHVFDRLTLLCLVTSSLQCLVSHKELGLVAIIDRLIALLEQTSKQKQTIMHSYAQVYVCQAT